jgi:serpin B
MGLLSVVLPAFLAAPAVAAATEPPSSDATRRLAGASNAFGFDVYGRIRSAPGNLAFSPASLTVGLLLPWGGARGETDSAFRRVLHVDGSPAERLPAWGQLAAGLQDPTRPVTLRIANRLFGEKSYAFDPAYLALTRGAFGSGLEAVDFRSAFGAARATINAWVEAQTERRIRDLVPPGGVSEETRLVLVNAIYFLGKWQRPFEASATRPAPFRATPTTTRDVPTMHQTGSFRLAAGRGARALELPYAGGGLAFLVVLPDAVDGLPAVESSLDAAGLAALVSGLAPKRVRVALPKFEVNPPASLPLGETLKGMGLAVAFDRTKADFRGIADPPDPRDRLMLQEVFHKAFVRVDEAGTEAAAATAASMMRVSSLPAPPEAEFRADHPFLFYLLDVESGLVLFAGRVADP